MGRNALTLFALAMIAATACVAAVVYLAPTQSVPKKAEGADSVSPVADRRAPAANSPAHHRMATARRISRRKNESLMSDLQTLRSQIDIYRIQHLDAWPSREIVAQLTNRTNAKGQIMPKGASPDDYPYGPYILRMPSNPFLDSAGVVTGTGTPPAGKAGWYYNVRTGRISANNPAHKDL